MSGERHHDHGRRGIAGDENEANDDAHRPASSQEGGRRRDSQPKSKTQESQKGLNWLERLVSGASLLLLLAVIGYLAWEGTRPTAPPAFQANVARTWQVGSDYYVLLDVRNDGDRSVQNLGVQAKVVDDGATLAQTSTTLSWLPEHSQRQVTVILTADPREHELVIGFEGYEVP